jgi:hypothetical protein
MACRSTTYECYPIDDESFMMVSNRGKRKEERGKRKEERGKRKEERGRRTLAEQGSGRIVEEMGGYSKGGKVVRESDLEYAST